MSGSVAGDADILELLKANGCEARSYQRQRPDLASVYRLVAGRITERDAGEDRTGRGDGGGSRGGGRGMRGGMGGGGGRGGGGHGGNRGTGGLHGR